MTDILHDFTTAIRNLGLTPPERVVADGKIHRFRSGPEHGQNGFYQLSVVPAHKGGDIGFGLIGCWKRDVSEKWCNREQKSITERDRSAMERVRREQKEIEVKEAAAAIARGKDIWVRCSPASADHPYLLAKGIEPRGIRQNREAIDLHYESQAGEKQRQFIPKDSLVVPIFREGSLVSLQFIMADGSKRFLKGGSVEAGYGSVGANSADKSKIVIAEGYATGVSLHMAMGLPVVIGFNAGNLVPVAKAIRAKYPEAEIVIGADSDQWTIVRGKPVNVGIEAAKKSAAAIRATVCWPVFAADDPERPTDWNDYAKRHGVERTAEAFKAACAGPPQDVAPAQDVPISEDPTPAPPPPDSYPEGGGDLVHDHESAPQEPAYQSDWRARLIPGKEVAEGHPFPFEGKSKTNAYLFLRCHHRFEGLLCYNEFTDSIMLTRRPPWESDARFSPRPIRDDDFFMLAANLEYCDISVSKDTAADAAIRVAKECSINPPREFLSRLQWDGKPRLDTWLTYYLGADEQPPEYLALVGSKWLIGAVSRVFEPGCKFDTVLILEGSQGIGKSMALRSLATFGGQDFFLDSVGDIRSKDTLMTMQGKLIVEIAELASFKKSENEEIKAFITRQVDEYRPPYGRTVLKRPRFFVLAASTNEVDEGIFTDETGNRRYWPVKCGAIDADALCDAAPQLWAEAVQRYRAGERTWLAREEFGHAEREQSMRLVEDAWKERVAGIVKHEWAGIRVDQVLDKLELKPKDINNLVKKRVKNSLRQLGWVETRRSGEGRVWRPSDGKLVAAAQESLFEDREIA